MQTGLKLAINNILFKKFTQVTNIIKPNLCWLDLQGCGLSIVERLCLEEALLRHDPQERCWGIVGTHKAKPHFCAPHKIHSNILEKIVKNSECAIVMGIGGIPEQLLDTQSVKEDGILVVRRFSGGGTIVVDNSSLWVTFIGRTHANAMPNIKPFPRDIMEWTSEEIFCPLFSSLRDRVQPNPSLSRNVPSFESWKLSLRENDYVIGEHKVGGNAQSIIRGGWLHHSSFLWDYVDEHMKYLSLPAKRPSYRGDRDHHKFLTKLSHYCSSPLNDDNIGKLTFFNNLQYFISRYLFNVEVVTLENALNIVNSELGGMQYWFDNQCRTKVISL